MAVLNIPIKLDVAEENIMSDVMAMQGDLDSRYLIVTVANNGIPMQIDKNSSVSINIKRPDEEQQTFTGEVNEDGTVKVMIPSWALVLEGVCNCNISFIETDGTILSTMPFNIVVNPSNATEIIVYVVYGNPLPAGTYYITIDDEDYSFTTTEEIPIGGTIRFSRDFTLASTYKCKVIEKDLPITNEAEGTKLSEGTNGGIIKQIIRFMSHIAQRTTQNEEDIDDINATIDNIEQNIDEIEENKRDRITDAHELDSVYIQKPDRTESHIEATSDSIENTIVVRNADGDFTVNTPTNDAHPSTKKYVDSLKSDTNQKIDDLKTYTDTEIRNLKDYTDNEISELTDYTDNKISDLTDYTNNKISDLKDYTDTENNNLKNYTDTEISDLKNYSDTELSKKVDKLTFEHEHNLAYIQKPDGTEGSMNIRAEEIPNTLVLRNENGIASILDPVTELNITNKRYVDNLGNTKVDKVTTTSNYSRLYGVDNKGNQTVYNVVANSTLAYSVVSRDANGHAEIEEPTSNKEIANKIYVDNKSSTGLQDAKDYADQKKSEANTYTDTKISSLVNSSPETLDTLKELADALGNDPNFATTVAKEIGKKVTSIAQNGTHDNKKVYVNGSDGVDTTIDAVATNTASTIVIRDVNGNTKVSDPVDALDASNKGYVDTVGTTNLNTAKSYTDAEISKAVTLANKAASDAEKNAKSYTDTEVGKLSTSTTTNIATALQTAKDYTDSEITKLSTTTTSDISTALQSAKEYTDTEIDTLSTSTTTNIANALNDAKDYTDSEIDTLSTSTTTNIASSLSTAKGYTDSEITKLSNTTTTNIATSLQSAKDYADSKVSDLSTNTNTELDKKLDKVTSSSSSLQRVYGITNTGNQNVVNVSTDKTTDNNSTIVLRDENGYIYTKTPSNDRHVPNKKYVDDNVTSTLDSAKSYTDTQISNISSSTTSGLNTKVDKFTDTHEELADLVYGQDYDGTENQYYVSPEILNNAIVERDATGRFRVEDPNETSEYDAVNVKYVKSSINSLNSNFNTKIDGKEDKFTKNTAFNKNFGTTADTVTEGNDPRLSDARPASDVSAWAKASKKPTYTKAEVGLGNVDNVKQYSASNPPPYPVTSVAGKTGAVSLTKSDVGLGNVTNDAQVKRTEMGSAGGVATLDTEGKVPASQLPSYVDDVIEYGGYNKFPLTGESGKIYVDVLTNKTYRWSGTGYTEIAQSIALGETSSTAYPGNKGKQNADNIASLQSSVTTNTSNISSLQTAVSQNTSSISTLDSNKANKTDVNSALNGKLDKDESIGSTERVYAVDPTGANHMIDASSSATANHLVQRDSNGYINVKNPTENAHPTTKKYVDDSVKGLVIKNTASHDHDLIYGQSSDMTESYFYATPDLLTNSLVKRDANFRAKIGTPEQQDEIANKGYVDSADAKKLDKIVGKPDNTSYAYTQSNGIDGSVKLDLSGTPNTIILRDNNGRASVADPVNNTDITNKKYVDNSVKGVKSSVYKQFNPLDNVEFVISLMNINDFSNYSSYNNFIDGILMIKRGSSLDNMPAFSCNIHAEQTHNDNKIIHFYLDKLSDVGNLYKFKFCVFYKNDIKYFGINVGFKNNLSYNQSQYSYFYFNGYVKYYDIFNQYHYRNAKTGEILDQEIYDSIVEITPNEGYSLSLKADKTEVATQLAGKEDTFTKNTAFNKNFGTTADTVTEGNDPRLSDARPASDVSAWAKASTKPTYTKAEVGLGNVDNVKQYSASNPPPYPVTSVAGKTGAVSLTKSDVGLGNVTNDAQVKRTEMGSAGGVATLDTEGKVPASQLPSYVDDVIEYGGYNKFPLTGESGKIYVDVLTNKTYRWSGTGYTEIAQSIALGETSSTAYPGNKGKQNADDIDTLRTEKANKDYVDGLISAVESMCQDNSGDISALQSTVSTINTSLESKADKTSLADYAKKDGSNASGIWNITSNSVKIISPANLNNQERYVYFADTGATKIYAIPTYEPTFTYNNSNKTLTVGIVNADIVVKDRRTETITPSSFRHGSLSTLFHSSNDNDNELGNWTSSIIVKGWTKGYNTWMLRGNSDSNVNSDHSLEFRNGIEDTWKPWRTIVDSKNYAEVIPAATETNNGLFTAELYNRLSNDMIGVNSYGLLVNNDITSDNPSTINNYTVSFEQCFDLSENLCAGMTIGGGIGENRWQIAAPIDNAADMPVYRWGNGSVWSDWATILTTENYSYNIPSATTSMSGLMSSTDKTKLDSLPALTAITTAQIDALFA